MLYVALAFAVISCSSACPPGSFYFDPPAVAQFTCFGYAAIVVVVGTRPGITSYIGFASTTPIPLTSYSDVPLHYQQAWLFRIYWALFAGVMLSVMHGYNSPHKPLLVSIWHSRPVRMPRTVAVAALATCLFAGFLYVENRAASESAQAPRAQRATSYHGAPACPSEIPSPFQPALKVCSGSTATFVDGAVSSARQEMIPWMRCCLRCPVL